jgi:hypothetical protein
VTAISALLSIPEAPVRGERPLFLCQAPDGRTDWGEDNRQTTFFSRLRVAAPSLIAWHIPNEGKRNPLRAKALGIRGGVFDICIASGIVGARGTAYIELKGYRANGRPGVLLDSQVSWGNLMRAAGHPVAMFFDPDAAIGWLRGVFPAAFMGGGL